MSAAQHTPRPWEVFGDTFRGKHVFTVGRVVGARGRVEFLVSERTGHKQRYFDALIAGRHADEANAAALAKAQEAAS